MVSLTDQDIDRFATLFFPATPPGTPTTTEPPHTRPRKASSDSDFGAFVSVPPSQDPLALSEEDEEGEDRHRTGPASVAAAQRCHVLEELLEHEDDPMYFYTLPCTTDDTDDSLAEALACEMHNPKLIQTPSVRVPLAPQLSSSSLPPPSSDTPSTAATASLSSSLSSLSSLSSSSSSTSTSTSLPAHATLSRISSLASLLPTTSRPSRQSSSRCSLTHGSPFASTPYIPPTGAPGFAGDRVWDHHHFSDTFAHEKAVHPVVHVGLTGRGPATARVLDEDMADLLRTHLPALARLARHWTLLYSLDQHGISLNTLYARCLRIPTRGHPVPQGGLLAIRDGNEGVFGAWLAEGIRLEKGGYYGSGESFLWRYHPSKEGKSRLDVYPWTGKNAYVALCEPGFVSFGGGDGHYGLYLDASLLDGSSAACPTFGNPPLCKGHGKDVPFECVGLEVWGIGPS